MSSNSLIISEEDNTKTANSSVSYRPLQKHSNYAVHYISSAFVKIEQLKTDLNAEYQYEKHKLIELNEQLRLMVDRAERLESQNSKYSAKLNDLRQQGFFIGITGTKNDEYYRLQNDIMTMNYDKVGYESEIELFQLQTKIYQQMIEFENQSIDEQRLKLEQELNLSASNLVNIHRSYAELEQRVGSYRAACKDSFQQYMKLTNDWSLVRRQTNELKIKVHMSKKNITLSKALYSKYDIISMDMSDFTELWKLEWKQIVNRIQDDFKVLYGVIHKETITFYEQKIKEVQVELGKIAQYQPDEQDQHAQIQQKIQIEYEEVQKKFAYEKEILLQSEATYYCPLDCTHIGVMNQSASEIIDISRWLLIRRVDSDVVFQYKIPDGLQLQPGSEIRVYSELGADAAKKLLSQSISSTSLCREVILKNVSSMGTSLYQVILLITLFYLCLGIGDQIETQLLDENGEEKASCIQTATTEWATCD
ncbi:unnamed protein product [Rotaria sp. Silwood2]|nr:unnamed protein product [Rotaria sp. Silwood2]CAF2919062.1 unnamed protein product [Rotaria sp. Silwood2]CAF3232244.1 unnamed protein product [Rotaria sp. Silwood2]